MTDFNSGALSDCETGCTLRTYLARKLHCTPMRISKKFPGGNVGKAVYVRKRPRSMPMYRPGIPGAPVPGCLDVHVEETPRRTLEALFYRSVDGGSCNVSGHSSAASSVVPTPSASLGPTPPPTFSLPCGGNTSSIPAMYQQIAANQQAMTFYPGFVWASQLQAQGQNSLPLPVPNSVSCKHARICIRKKYKATRDP